MHYHCISFFSRFGTERRFVLTIKNVHATLDAPFVRDCITKCTIQVTRVIISSFPWLSLLSHSLKSMRIVRSSEKRKCASYLVRSELQITNKSTLKGDHRMYAILYNSTAYDWQSIMLEELKSFVNIQSVSRGFSVSFLEIASKFTQFHMRITRRHDTC